MPDENTLTSLLAGVAGEYLVAAELSLRGYIASITLRNTRGVDILCSSSDATRSVGIQVKTNRGSRREWIMNEKADTFHADNLFYVFVNLNDLQKPPEYFIVPSKDVAAYTSSTHLEWMSTLDRKGEAHKDGPMRKFRDVEEAYLQNWDVLGLSSWSGH
jgi:hypothetical protein